MSAEIGAISIANSVGHTAIQAALGVTLGQIIDWTYNEALLRLGSLAHFYDGKQPREGREITCYLDAVINALEMAGQLIIGGLIIGSAMTYLTRLDTTIADPAGGMIFTICYFASQPALFDRLKRLQLFIARELSRADKEFMRIGKEWQPNQGKLRDAGGATRREMRRVAINTGIVDGFQAHKTLY
jgi:hypothetical protein